MASSRRRGSGGRPDVGAEIDHVVPGKPIVFPGEPVGNLLAERAARLEDRLEGIDERLRATERLLDRLETADKTRKEIQAEGAARVVTEKDFRLKKWQALTASLALAVAITLGVLNLLLRK